MEDHTKNRVSEILASFKYYDGVYKREEINAAIELKEEITPALIKVLEDLLSNPQVYIEDGELYDHIYSVMLLGHFKEHRVHKLLIDIFCLPDDLPDKLFGDICTSDLPALLFNTCNGSIDSMKSMVRNTAVNEYIRISGCQAIAYSTVSGYVSREDTIEFFNSLFTGNEADKTSDFWGLLACIVCDLYPEEIMDTIEASYENGLISPGIIGYESFKKTLDMGKEKSLQVLKEDMERHSLDDFHAAMSWWACFQDNTKHSGSLKLKAQKASSRKQSSAKKKKRKQSKKSRKKNRR